MCGLLCASTHDRNALITVCHQSVTECNVWALPLAQAGIHANNEAKRTLSTYTAHTSGNVCRMVGPCMLSMFQEDCTHTPRFPNCLCHKNAWSTVTLPSHSCKAYMKFLCSLPALPAALSQHSSESAATGGLDVSPGYHTLPWST